MEGEKAMEEDTMAEEDAIKEEPVEEDTLEEEPVREDTLEEELEDEDLLISVDDYLAAGVHIGTQQKTKPMERFIHEVREDGLYILDVEATDKRISIAADFLERYSAPNILIVSSRQYGKRPAEAFAEATGAAVIEGRFSPGALTNPQNPDFIEPDVLLATDPAADSQAVEEAVTSGIPVVAICDTNNTLQNVDIAIPANNKGRKSLSLVYYLLTRELIDRRGDETDYELEDFEPI